MASFTNVPQSSSRSAGVNTHGVGEPLLKVLGAEMGRGRGCRGSSRRPPSSSRRAIVMVQPAEHGKPHDRAIEPGSGAFTRDGNLLTDPLMRPSRVEVVDRILREDVP